MGSSDFSLDCDSPRGLDEWLALNRRHTERCEHRWRPYGGVWICEECHESADDQCEVCDV